MWLISTLMNKSLISTKFVNTAGPSQKLLTKKTIIIVRLSFIQLSKYYILMHFQLRIKLLISNK